MIGMNFLKRIILGSLLLLLPYLSKAQNLEVEVRLDTNEVLIGDQVVLHVKAEYSCDVDVELPLLNDTLAKGVEILSASPVDTSVSDDNICKLSQTYIM